MEDEGRKARAEGKRPCVETPSSASATSSGRRAQAKGKHPFLENSSSGSATTGMEAPLSPRYVNYSEYPLGTDIEYELVWENGTLVPKVSRGARIHWRMKYGGLVVDDDSPYNFEGEDLPLQSLKKDEPFLAAAAAEGHKVNKVIGSSGCCGWVIKQVK